MNRTSVIGILVEDLLFRSKIETTARQLGIEFENPPTADASLVVLDLHLKSADPVEWIRRFKSSERTRQIPILGFFSHVRIDLKKRAVAAGCNLVVPRSVFSDQLPQLLTRYVKIRAANRI